MNRRRPGFAIALTALALMVAGAPPAESATLEVCKSGCPYATIRAAVRDANSGDTIQIAAGIYVEALRIRVSVTLQGAGTSSPNETSIGHGGEGAVIDIAGATVVIKGVTITSGDTGIANSGTLTVANCVIRSNGLRRDLGRHVRGGIWNDGELLVMDTAIFDNHSSDGGGILNSAAAVATVRHSVIENNLARGFIADTGRDLVGGYGGGIYNNVTATLMLIDSVVRHNHSRRSGGGIHNYGSLTVQGSLIENNQAEGRTENGEPIEGLGGGLSNSGSGASAILNESSVTDNAARQDGGGIENDLRATIALRRTTILHNIPNNCAGTGVKC
jgi:hypothetical protein